MLKLLLELPMQLHFIAKKGYYIFSRATKISKLVALLATNDLPWIFTPVQPSRAPSPQGSQRHLKNMPHLMFSPQYRHTLPSTIGRTLLSSYTCQIVWKLKPSQLKRGRWWDEGCQASAKFHPTGPFFSETVREYDHWYQKKISPATTWST